MSAAHCFQNPPSISSIGGAGSIQEIAGFKAYVTGSQDSKRGILLISDAFGYEGENYRKLADKVAAAGFFVVAPDFLYGDPFDLSKDVYSWIKDHSPVKGCEDAKTVIAALRSKGVSTIGAAGFCWGGLVVVKLARFDDIKAAVILHPGLLTEEEMKEVKVPIAILGAEIDEYCPPDHLKGVGEILSAKCGVDNYVKIFPGVGHGWTVRYNAGDEDACKSAEEAHKDMLDWHTKYVK